VGTFGDARGTGSSSSAEVSGVVGREGRRRDVREGEGGRGVGGRPSNGGAKKLCCRGGGDGEELEEDSPRYCDWKTASSSSDDEGIVGAARR